MRKLLSILFLSLIASISLVSGALAAKPDVSTYFDNTPWESTYKNKYWLPSEDASHCIRQLYYTAYDRCVVVGITMPWYTEQYTLACGWQTCKNLRVQGATNVLQLLRDVTVTSQVFSIQYPVALDVQNKGSGFAMSNAPVAIDAKTFWALDSALMAVVNHYVPYAVYDAITSFSNIPTYCNIGAVLYEFDEYQDLVTDIVWDDSHKYIESCNWTWGTNSLPHPVSSDPTHDTATSLVLLSALDCRAKIISMLKYPLYDGIPCSQGSIANLTFASGYGDAVVPEYTYPEVGDWGDAGSPLGYAYLGTSHNTSWAGGWKYNTAGKDGADWKGVGDVLGTANSDNENADWPDSGWLGSVDYSVSVDLSRDGAANPWYINGTVNPNVKWDESHSPASGGWLAPEGQSTYTDTINGHYQGGTPASISVKWDSETSRLIMQWVPQYTAEYDIDVAKDQVTNSAPTTNVISGYEILYGWSNLTAGVSLAEKLYTYAYLGGQFFEFTNDNPKAATVFTNFSATYLWYAYTTMVDAVYTTNQIHTTSHISEIIPGHYDYIYPGYPYEPPAPVPTSGSWSLTTGGGANNYIEACSAIYDSRPNVNIAITKLDKDHAITSMQCYMVGDGDRPDVGILGYPEWDDIGYSNISPIPAAAGLTPTAVKLMGAGNYNTKDFMYYYSLMAGVYGNPYNEYYSAGPVRIYFGIKQSWWIGNWEWPKRKEGILPCPKSE